MSAKRTIRAKRECAFRANDPLRYFACFATLAFALALLFLLPCKAYGDEGDSLDVEFIEKLADEAGLDSGRFVVSAVTSASYVSGNPLWVGTVNLSSDLVHALDNIVEAADYPAWDTLSQAQKELYGSKKNYDARKFNSLMRGFGYSGVYDDFIGSGGGNLDLSTELKGKLGQLGRIGSLWASGAGVIVGQLQGLVNAAFVNGWVPQSDGSVIDGSDVDGWPSGVNKFLYGYPFVTCHTNSRYRTIGTDNSNAIVFPFYRNVFAISKTPFNLGSSLNSSSYIPITNFNFAAESSVVNGETVYYKNVTSSDWHDYDQTDNGSLPAFLNTNENKAKLAYLILYGDVKREGNEKIEGYPEGEEDDDTPTYFPKDGIDGDTSWNTITTPPGGSVEPRPETPFNPGNQTDTPKWKNETTQNVIELGNLPFDKLFPFCLLYDVPLLLDKIMGSTSAMRAQGSVDYTVIQMRIPDFNGIGLEGFDITLDLDPLQEILNMVRPVFQMMVIALLLFTAIEFWKSIITG